MNKAFSKAKQEHGTVALSKANKQLFIDQSAKHNSKPGRIELCQDDAVIQIAYNS